MTNIMNNQSFFILFQAEKIKNPEYQPKQLPKNIYDAYIEHLKNRKLDDTNSSQIFETHHVVPLHKSKIKRFSNADKNQEKILLTSPKGQKNII